MTSIHADADAGTKALAPGLVALLHGWADQGWLRRLDSALAAFMLELDAEASPALLVATALLAQMEGRGHTCLPLRPLVVQPNAVLAWPEAGRLALDTLWQSLPAGLPDWLLALQASPLVRSVGVLSPAAGQPAPDRGQPLVLAGTAAEPLLYLRRYWRHECDVAAQVLRRTGTQHLVDPAQARQWLDRLFDPASAERPNTTVVDWQKLACAVALRASLTVITGGPGTGKTYAAARLLALLLALHPEPQRLRIALAAPTGKAAARLRQSIDASLQALGPRLGSALDLAALAQRMGAAKTLHGLLGARPDTRQFAFHAGRPLELDILIVDEASMIHLEMMAALLQAMPPGAKLILLGDKDQLASVEAGAVLGDLCRDAQAGQYDAATARYALAVAGQTLPAELLASGAQATPLAQQTVMLRQSRRFGGAIGQLALAVNQGQGDAAWALLTGDASRVLQLATPQAVRTVLGLAVAGRPGAPACYADYLGLLQRRPADSLQDTGRHAAWVAAVLQAFDRFRILCAIHASDWGTRHLNLVVQTALAEAGLLLPRGDWYAGRPVMVTRNDAELGVFNGDVGVALPGPGRVGPLRVYFLDGEQLRSVAVSRLSHVETAFAMSVHKCQGSEFLHTVLVLPQWGAGLVTRELLYTGITRARQHFTLVQAQDGLLQQAVGQHAQRASGLLGQLQSGLPAL
jgi:exodeoxyribonuclease V alpha subunit